MSKPPPTRKGKRVKESWREASHSTEDHLSANVFLTLRDAYRPFRFRIAFALLTGLAGRLLILGNANVIGIWVDSLCQKLSPQHLDAPNTIACQKVPAVFANFSQTDYLWVLSLLVLVGFVATTFFRVYFSRMSAQAISRIYDEVTLRTSRFPMSFFDRQPVGRIVTRFSSDYGNVFRLFGGPLAEFISIIFDLVAVVILATLASPLFLIYVGLIAICYYYVFQFNKARLRRARRSLSEARSPSIAHFAESAQGASTIRTFRKEASFSQRYQFLDEFYLDLKLKAARHLTSFSFQMNALTSLLLLVMGLTSYFFIQRGWVSVGAVGVAFGFIAFSGNSVQFFFEWLSQLEDALIGVDRLDKYLRSPLEPGNALPMSAEFQTDHPKRDFSSAHSRKEAISVRVEDLWFRYSEKQKWVLKGLSFQIQPGEVLGVIGRTGSGKSSLIQALFNLYPIDKGRIHLDGQLVTPLAEAEVPLVNYREWMAYISQDPILFRGTLRENLDLKGQLNDDDLKQGLKLFYLDHLLEPLGLDFQVEERGRNLSLGERQLVCMARCLLQDTPVIILDEATASIDPQTEESILKIAAKYFAGKTQILIAHRLSTLDRCDRVLWIDNGEQVMIDTPQKVINAFHAAQSPPVY